VFLPPDLPLNIDAMIEESFGHKIVSDFPIHLVTDDEDSSHGPKRGEGELNGGGKVLRIRTTMGNIEIHRLDSHTLEQFKLRQEDYWKRWEDATKARKVKEKKSDDDEP